MKEALDNSLKPKVNETKVINETKALDNSLKPQVNETKPAELAQTVSANTTVVD